MKGIRGAILLIVLWTIGWGLGFGGIMELVDSDGRIQDIWPATLGIPGFIGGIIFSALLLIAERGRPLYDISIARFAVWGVISGLLLGLLSIPAEVGDVSPGAAGMTGIGAGLGLISGLGCGIFCRLFAGRRAPNAVS